MGSISAYRWHSTFCIDDGDPGGDIQYGRHDTSPQRTRESMRRWPISRAQALPTTNSVW